MALPAAVANAMKRASDHFQSGDFIRKGTGTIVLRLFGWTNSKEDLVVSQPVTSYHYKTIGERGKKEMLHVTSPSVFGKPDPLGDYLMKLRNKRRAEYDELVGYDNDLNVKNCHVLLVSEKPKSLKDKITKLSRYEFTIAMWKSLQSSMEDEGINVFDPGPEGAYVKIKATLDEREKVKGYSVAILDAGPFSSSEKQQAQVEKLIEDYDASTLVSAFDPVKYAAIFEAVTGQKLPKDGAAIKLRDGDEEDEDETPKKKAKVADVDESDEDEDDEEVKPKKKAKKVVDEDEEDESDEDEDSDTDEDDDEEEEAPKKSKKKVVAADDEDDEDSDDEDEDSDDEDDEDETPKKKVVSKVSFAKKK